MTKLFGLLLLCQTFILLLAVILFSRLPGPEMLVSQARNLAEAEQSDTHLEQLAVQSDYESQEANVVASRTVAYTIKKRDTLAAIWTRNGAPQSGATLAAQAFREAGISPGALRAGGQVELTLSLDGDITDYQQALDKGRMLVLQGNSVDGYEASVLAADVEEQEKTVSGTIFTSLSAAASSLSIPYSVVDEYVDLFSNRVEFRRDLQPGDSFTVTYLERICRRSGATIESGKIVSASLYTGEKLMAALAWKSPDGATQYFDESGKALGNYFLRYPVSFSRISSAFSWARFHPVLQRSRPHLGVDFAAPNGTPVRTVADGVVVEAGFKGDAGNMVVIRHGSRLSTIYMHLSKISADVKKGARVSRGEIIGAVGNTGLSTGSHLHYELHDNGKYVDPMKAELPAMENAAPIPPAYLTAQLETLRLQHKAIALAAVESGRRAS